MTFNKAANPIPASDIYFDLPVQTVPGVLDVWVLGAKNPYSFGANPQIDWLIPGVPNTPFAAGFPLAAAFQAVNGDVLAGIEGELSKNPQLASLIPLVQGVLQNAVPQGFASINNINEAGEPFLPEGGQGNLISFVTSYELGYKGLIGDRFAFGVNIYHLRNKGGAGFQQISPMINIANLGSELADAVTDLAIPQLEQGLINLGLDSATAAATVAGLAPELNAAYQLGGEGFINALQSAGLPFHGVDAAEQSPDREAANLLFGYLSRDPNRVSEDWGAEAHTRFLLTDDLVFNANYTWFQLSDGEPGDLNFPLNKVRVGLQYRPAGKFNAALNYQWDQSYKSNNANYVGRIDAKSLVDMTLGYQLSNVVKFELSATNLFNNEFRALPGFPRIGRIISGRLLFNFN